MLTLKLLLLVLISKGLAGPSPNPSPEPEPAAKAEPDAVFPPGFGSPGPDFDHPGPGFPIGHSPFKTSASSSGDHSHCALLIPGHGKSSNFDHTLDVFNGIHGSPHGGDDYTCISFQSIDIAFIAARDKFGLPRPKKPVDTKQLANLGRVLGETTRILAKQYSLPKDVIVNGLPLVDSLKSIIGTICLDFVKVVDCKETKYRRYDGRCNNLKHPHWGSALTTFKRRIGPDYADGVDKPRVSKSGGPLPSARAVSAHLHRDEGLHDHAVTIMCVAWGQAIDHDMTFTGETKIPGTSEDPRCCDRDANFPACFPIRVSHKDAFFSLFKQDCISVTRSAPGVPYGCKLGPRSQTNEVSSYLDANWVYGSKTSVVNRLRLFKGGLMKSLPVFREFGMKDLLPLKLEEPEEGCIRPNKDLFCFDAGDGRVNEQLVLAVIHTMMMREHNRLAIELHKINPHWDDETLYQEARHILAAITQHITYNEFLPMVLGKEVMQKFGLLLEKHGYFDGYDPKIDASMSADFTTSAFRFGHSLLPSTIERWSAGHKYIASQRLSGMLRQPYDLYKGGWCDQFTMGLCNQVAQAMDDSITQEVTNHLFQEPKKKFGMDLPAINMQRAREHGVPSYNEFRRFCGLHAAKSWHELEGIMPNKTVKRYSDIYKHPEDVDLFTGGVSERPLPGAMVGPTFSCLIGITFKELRYGDRYWYENSGFKSSFSSEQLEEIRKIKLSRIICDNSDDIKTVQVYAMVLPDHDINPRVPCASGILPKIDLTKWRDHHRGPHHLHHGPSHIHHGPPLSPNPQPEISSLPEETNVHFISPSDEGDITPTKDYPPSRSPNVLSNLDVPDFDLTRFISQDSDSSSQNYPQISPSPIDGSLFTTDAGSSSDIKSKDPHHILSFFRPHHEEDLTQSNFDHQPHYGFGPLLETTKLEFIDPYQERLGPTIPPPSKVSSNLSPDEKPFRPSKSFDASNIPIDGACDCDDTFKPIQDDLSDRPSERSSESRTTYPKRHLNEKQTIWPLYLTKLALNIKS